MYRLSLLTVLLFLATSFFANSAYALQNDKSWQIGIHSNYYSQSIFDNESMNESFWGAGLVIKKELNDRIFVGTETQFYAPKDHTFKDINVSGTLETNQFMQSIFAGANLYTNDVLRVYSTIGYQYRLESIKGERVFYNDAPPFNVYTQTLDFNKAYNGLRLSTGFSINIRSMDIFAEPTVMILNGLEFSLSTGIRLAVW